MVTEKLVEGFNSLGYVYGFSGERCPATLRVEDGEVLLMLLAPEDSAKNFMDSNEETSSNVFLFHSTDVTVNLTDFWQRHSKRQLFTNINTRTFVCHRAVVSTKDKDYSEINGARSELEGFARWAELSGIELETTIPVADNKSPVATLTARAMESVDLGTRFSIAATSGITSPGVFPFQQEYTFRDIVTLRTKTESLTSWSEFQVVHRMIQDLMCLVYNYPCELTLKSIYREDDQPEHLRGGQQKRWAEAVDKDFGRKRYFEPKKSIDAKEPLFLLKDTSADLVEDWLENLEIWSRATWIAVETIFQPHLAVESRLIQIGVALEALGYAIWLHEEHQGIVPPGRKPSATGYFRRVAEKIPFADLKISDEGAAQAWAEAFNEVYKGCKHADNPLPDGLEAYERANQGLAVMRCWLAKRLGVTDEVLIKNKDRLK